MIAMVFMIPPNHVHVTIRHHAHTPKWHYGYIVSRGHGDMNTCPRHYLDNLRPITSAESIRSPQPRKRSQESARGLDDPKGAASSRTMIPLCMWSAACPLLAFSAPNLILELP